MIMLNKWMNGRIKAENIDNIIPNKGDEACLSLQSRGIKVNYLRAAVEPIIYMSFKLESRSLSISHV